MGLFNKTVKRSYTSEKSEENNNVPAWLKMLQENSWELEILISGGAIFSLFGLSDLVTDFYRTLSNTNTFTGQNMMYISTMLATKTLTLGFFIHVLLRSFWVALVALSSMFNNEDHSRKIRYVKPFNTSASLNLPDYIIRLDKLSAWMIYNSFTLAFILTGWIILLFIITSTLQLIGDPFASILEPIAAGLYIIYLVDFMLFSAFRKIPYLSYLVFPIFKVFDFISLRFVYQPGIDYLSSYVARWKTALFFIFFLICAGIFTYLSIQKRLGWPNIFDDRKYRSSLTIADDFHTRTFYRSTNAEGVERVSIQSDIITEPVLNLFIAYSIRYEEFIDKIENEEERYFENIFKIQVDDSVFNQQKFYPTSMLNKGPSDRGISTYIDLSSFKNGLHELKIKIKLDEDAKHTRVVIPFWLHKESFD